MKALLILTILLAGVSAPAETVIYVQRQPLWKVTLDANSNEVACATCLTRVKYIVDIAKPDGVGGFHDEVEFDSFQNCLDNPSIVTNTILTRATPWRKIFNVPWDFENGKIVFSVLPLLINTNYLPDVVVEIPPTDIPNSPPPTDDPQVTQ